MPSSVAATLLNAGLIRERRLQLNIPTRELGRRSGLSGPTIRRIESGESAPDLTLGDLYLLATALVLDMSDLLVPQPGRERAATLDSARVEALLATAGRLVRKEEIALAFEWDLGRVATALNDLDDRMRGTGQRLHRHPSGTVSLQASPIGLTSEERESAVRAAYQHRGVNRRTAQVLAPLIETRRMPIPATNAGRVGAGELAAAAIARIEGDELVLEDDCVFSLMLD